MSINNADDMGIIPEYSSPAGEKPQWLHGFPFIPDNTDYLDFGSYGVDKETLDILFQIKFLSRKFSADLARGSAEESMEISHRFCNILERLLRMSPATDESPLKSSISESCRYAAALHVFSPLSGYYPDPALMVSTLMHKLRDSLKGVFLAIGTYDKLILWLLSVGAISANNKPERSWFVGHLVVAATDLDLQSWDQMRGYLLELPWFDSFCETSFGLLWQETTTKRASLETSIIG